MKYRGAGRMKGFLEKLLEDVRDREEMLEKIPLREINAFEPMAQRICPNCAKDCMIVMLGTLVFLGRKRKGYYKTVCEGCGIEWYIDERTHEAFTKEELQQKYKTYF